MAFSIALLTLALAVVIGVQGDEHDTLRAGPYLSPVALSGQDATASLTTLCIDAFQRLEGNNVTVAKMLDSMGKPGAGIAQGDFAWYGDYTECQSLSGVKYCVSNFKATLSPHATRSVPMRLGVCVPKECTAYDAAILPTNLDKAFQYPGESFVLATVSEFFSSHTVENSTYGWCMEPTKYTTGTIVTLVFLGVLVALLLVGTAVDSFFFPVIVQPSVGVLKVERSADTQRPPLNGFGGAGEAGNLQYTGRNADETTALLAKPVAPSFTGPRHARSFLEALRCFSVSRKLNIILAAEHKPGTIPCLHGLRFFSMCWVILGHSYLWPLFVGEANVMYTGHVMTRTSFQFVLNGTFSVDTFFFLSGLLVTYLTLKHMESTGGSVKWPMFYLHRFLRLTPLYMFVILLFIYIVPFIGAGPMWISVISSGKACSDYWWSNLLYINNFYPTAMNSQCIAWSWYLANDMQFFIISPIVIIAAYRFRNTGVAITAGSLVLISLIARGVITYHYNLRVSAVEFAAFGAPAAALTPAETPKGDSQSILYEKPYTRVTTYAIGMATGYVIRRLPRIPSVLPRSSRLALAVVAWVLAATLLIVPLWSLTSMYKDGTTLSMAASIMYNTFSRFSWGLGLAILVLLCHMGYGGFVNSFLSHPMWIPLSRLTFGAYLVHPIVLFMIFVGLGQPVFFTDSAMIFYYLAAVLASYIISLVLATGLEYPLLELEMRIFGR